MEPSLGLSQAEVAECSNSNKRLSKDSGTGSDIEQDSLRGMYSRKSSHGRNSDSGVCVRACVCMCSVVCVCVCVCVCRWLCLYV